MARQELTNGISGFAFRKILNDNFTDLYENKANKNHASSTSEYGVSSSTDFGHIKVTPGAGLSISSGVLSLSAATTAEATAGTSTTTVMSPARVKEAVNAYGVISDGNTIIKISNTQPATQTGKSIIWIDTSS